MNTTANLSSEIARLTHMVNDENPFALSIDEVREAQLEAINNRFQSRIDKIKLLQNRAEEGGITEVRRMEDIVPLLFAHTAYKSYPENWLMEHKWERLGKWLDSVSTNRVRADGHGRREGPRRLAAPA